MNIGIFKMLNAYINLYTSITIVLGFAVLFYWLFVKYEIDAVFFVSVIIFWPFHVIKFALKFSVKVLNRFIYDMIHL